MKKLASKNIFTILVLAILIISGVALYLKNAGNNKQTINVNSKVPKAQSDMVAKMQDKLPAPKSKMIVPNINEITGKWLASFSKNSLAELTLINGAFELIYTDDPQGRDRKYSRGNYKYNNDNGKITLYSSKSAGAPKAIKGVKYRILTNRSYDIFISKKQGDHDIYFSAPEYQIIPKSFHPLFLYADYAGAPVIKFSPLRINKGK